MLNHIRFVLPRGAFICIAVWMLTCLSAGAAENGSSPKEVLAKAKGWVVTRGDLDKMVKRVQTELMSTGSLVQEDKWGEFEGRLLDQLILIQICRARATDSDLNVARTNADAFIHRIYTNAPTEADYARRLTRAGYTPESFSQEKYDEAIVNAVIAREVKKGITVSNEEVEKAYADHPENWKMPESVRVAELMMEVRNPLTGAEISEDEYKRKLSIMQELRGLAQKPGADFAALVKDNSEDSKTRQSGGEITLFRGQAPWEFEAACFSLPVGQVSDVVTTAVGLYLIKSLEKIPARVEPLEKVRDRIREALIEDKALRELPAFAERLRREAGVELSPNAPKLPPQGPGRPPSKL